MICEHYKNIKLNFIISDHIKFKYNSSFRLIKKLYCKITVNCIDHIVNVIKKSSIARLNKAYHYNGKINF